MAQKKQIPARKTKRLAITPLTDGEMRLLIEKERDGQMKKALEEMLAGCEAHPGERMWYAYWLITLRENGEAIGGLCFHGAPVNGAVEIGYGIHEARRGQGYATEAVGNMMDWAFEQGTVYVITARAGADNAASRAVLEHLGFCETADGSFEREKPQSTFMTLYMAAFMGVGLCFGVAFDNLAIGLCFGVGIGLCIGSAMDAQDRKKRAECRARREQEKNGEQK